MIKFYAIYNMEDELVATFDNYKEICNFFKRTKDNMQSSISNFKANRTKGIKSNDNGKLYKIYVMEDEEMEEDEKTYLINKLTELLIKQDFEDKQKGKDTYIKKTQCYKDLIKFIKELEND